MPYRRLYSLSVGVSKAALLPNRSWQPLIYLLLGLTIGIAVMVACQLSPSWRHWELSLYDARLRLTRIVPDERLVLLPVGDTGPGQRQELAALVDALGRSRARVIGVDVPLDVASTPVADAALARSFAAIPGVVTAAHLTGAQPPRYMLPLPVFQVACGLSMPIADADGAIRRATLLQAVNAVDGHLVLRPSYLLELARRVDPAAAARQQARLGATAWGFRYTLGPWRIVEPSAVLAGQVDVAGKAVLIGDAQSLAWQAPALQALMHDRIVRPVGDAWNYLLCLLAGLITGLVFWFGRPMAGLAGAFGLTVLLAVVNVVLFRNADAWYWLLGPSAAAGLTGLACGTVAGIERFRQHRRVARFFRPYVSPQTVQALLRDPENLPTLKSERRVVTVLFSDIAGFTSISERLPTEEVVQLLNEYLTAMTRIIFQNNGTLDKYIGDEVMAVFGNIGPNNPPDDAYRAVKSALEMQVELGYLQEKWLAEGIVPLQIRIGINSGEALVGNIGSPQQMDFTVIGDMVNTAKRLEGLNKAYNTNILISQATYNYVKEKVETRFLGPAPIKGRHEPVPVYGLIGWQQPTPHAP
jgi:class 3 adenylate cyclase/CHASE2 domain-containing sensor protein